MTPTNQLNLGLTMAKLQATKASGCLSALGACIFGGGFSFGVERAGFEVAGHLELPDLALGSSTSRQCWPVSVMPFEGSDPDSWMDFSKRLVDLKLVPDFVYANPPCVAYAGTGARAGAADVRMCYTRHCSYGLGFTLQPTVWAWELVPGVFDREKNFLEAMAFRAQRLGYRCYSFLTSSALHGGYQDRRRFHFVASKVQLDFEGVYARQPAYRKGSNTLGDALVTLAALKDEYGDLPNDQPLSVGAFGAIMPYCVPGSHLRDVPDSIMRLHYRPNGQPWDGQGRPGFAHVRGRLDKPCPNVLGGPTVIHPLQDRYLTPREAATVMGFPVKYAFSLGGKGYAEIGKGLCTHNAQFLADVVMDGLRRGVGSQPVTGGDTWMEVVDFRPRAPKLNLVMPKPVRAVWWNDVHGHVPGDL